jgi:hypothetical protein
MAKHATRDMERARCLPHRVILLALESKAWPLKLIVGQWRHSRQHEEEERESGLPFPFPLQDDTPALLYSG